jgi:hypothetical protein
LDAEFAPGTGERWWTGNLCETVMLSPGFVGVPITARHHQVALRYQPEKWQAIPGMGGVLIALLLIAWERRRFSWQIRPT